MKKQVLFVTLAAAMLASCSNEENVSVAPSTSSELGVSVNVLSGVNTRSLRDGVLFESGDAIGVFVGGTGYTPKVAAYTFTDSDTDGTPDTWVSPTTSADKIYLSNELATVYAFYPSDATVSGTLAGDGTDKIEGSLGSLEASFDGSGQTDYMYGTSREGDGSGTPAYTYPLALASNAPADGTGVYDKKVDLYMHHVFTKLSFVVNKAETYSGTGLVTSIKVNPPWGGTTVLSGSFTLKLSDGALDTSANAGGETLTFISDPGVVANEYSSPASTDIIASGLVFPCVVDGITLTLTIDGKEMTATLPYLIGDQLAWKAGDNYIYTLLVKGTELEVTTVSIVDWNAVDVNSGDPVDLN